jgi:predicted CXXCH cytochrome family protein
LIEINHVASPGRSSRGHARGAATGLLVFFLAVAPGAVRALDAGDPLPWGSKPVSSHAPYVSRDCTLCHVKRSGGRLLDETDHMCVPCHEDALQHRHAPRHCTHCHNAHDSMRGKLLRADLEKCGECHQKKG